MVVATFNLQTRAYAASILKAIELLVFLVVRPPAMASEVNRGGCLERRFQMIVSERPVRANSPLFRISVLLCAVFVLPLGLVVAQDFDAVERRLGAGVSEGELTLEEAAEMLARLREIAEEHHFEERPAKGGVGQEISEYLKSVAEQLKAAVKAGKLSEGEAWFKWRTVKEEKIGPWLKHAVEEHELTEEAAWRIWKSIERDEVAQRIKSAVARGDLSEHDGRERWESYLGRGAFKKREANETERRLVESIERFRGEIESRSVEENRREVESLKRHYRWEEEQGNEDRIRILGLEIRMIEESLENPSVDAILERFHGWVGETGERIKEAVEQGQLTEEDAWKKWGHFKEKQLGPALRQVVQIGDLPEEKGAEFWRTVELAETGERIKAAVERGELTEDEAKAKWAELMNDKDD